MEIRLPTIMNKNTFIHLDLPRATTTLINDLKNPHFLVPLGVSFGISMDRVGCGIIMGVPHRLFPRK